MAATDYDIVLGMSSAYFAKKKKMPSNIMSADRRAITEGEVMMLVDFYLDNYCRNNGNCRGVEFVSNIRSGKKIKMVFVSEADDKTH